ncbi:MAG: hypothetical protein WCT77_05715 [Bacteroidota bacterium]
MISKHLFIILIAIFSTNLLHCQDILQYKTDSTNTGFIVSQDSVLLLKAEVKLLKDTIFLLKSEIQELKHSNATPNDSIITVSADTLIRNDTSNIDSSNISKKRTSSFALGVLCGLPGLLYATIGVHSKNSAIRINIGGSTFDFKIVFNWNTNEDKRHGIFFNIGSFSESGHDNFFWIGTGVEFNWGGFHLSPGFIGFSTGIPMAKKFDKLTFVISPQLQIGYIWTF